MSEMRAKPGNLFPKAKTLFATIDQLMNEKEHVVVAIDGDCAAGKTTLSTLLSLLYDCQIIHMDHFFLRPEQRTPERTLTPGGNMDYERFSKAILSQLKKNAPFSYRPFDCITEDFEEAIEISADKLTLIEGSYSHHPEFQDGYDLKVFLSIPADVQTARILKRNGEDMLKRFQHTWIPMEKQYAKAFNIQENSDLQLDYLNMQGEGDDA